MWWCFRKCCYSRIPEITSEIESFTIFDENNNRIYIEKLECISSDIYIKKYKIADGNRSTVIEANNILNQRPVKPWVWIGDDRDMTEEIEPFVVHGNKITLKILNLYFPSVKEWRYCSKTLEMLDFPSEGIIINDTNKQTIEKED